MAGPGNAGAELERDGWTVARGLFSPAECEAIAASSARRTWPATTRDLVRRVHDPRWADLVLSAVGPHVRAFREQPLTKEPHSEHLVPWHQDHSYAPLDPPRLLTCLLALEPIDEHNGCLWVQPGTHLDGPVPHEPAGAISAVAGAEPGGGTPVVLDPGDVLALHSLTWHRSGPNTTSSKRPMWLIQFCDAHARLAHTGAPVPDHAPVVAYDGTWLPAPPS